MRRLARIKACTPGKPSDLKFSQIDQLPRIEMSEMSEMSSVTQPCLHRISEQHGSKATYLVKMNLTTKNEVIQNKTKEKIAQLVYGNLIGGRNILMVVLLNNLATVLRSDGVSRTLLNREMDPVQLRWTRECRKTGGDNPITELHVWNVERDEYACTRSVVAPATPPSDHYCAWNGRHDGLRHVAVDVHQSHGGLPPAG